MEDAGGMTPVLSDEEPSSIVDQSRDSLLDVDELAGSLLFSLFGEVAGSVEDDGAGRPTGSKGVQSAESGDTASRIRSIGIEDPTQRDMLAQAVGGTPGAVERGSHRF